MSDSVLLNLLAVIHGDGGHYVARHGLEKAVDDAKKVINKLKQIEDIALDIMSVSKYMTTSPIPVPRLTGDGMYVVTVPTETSYIYGYGDTPGDAIRSAEVNKSMLKHESDK